MSKRSKACDISPKVRQIVYDRDGGCCIICGKQGIPNAHYISRAHGGLGVRTKYSYALPYLPPCVRQWK